MERAQNKRTKFDINFENVCYSVPHGSKSKKTILKNINGYIKSESMTAIIGPSGGGKTTLLNVLAGYRTTNVTGSININGKKRDIEKFYKYSRYILSEVNISSFLTVKECMWIAAKFKLKSTSSEQELRNLIAQSLEELNLSNCEDTLTNDLSGGEKKRLMIAMELLDCPSIIFLDEPTTGLDDYNCYDCISLLKKLTKHGISVVCSIHTPSPKVLDKFDHVYAIADGQCIYQGVGSGIVTFLKQIQLNCPLHYNSTDFLIEVSTNAYGNYIDNLVELTNNGTITYAEGNVKINIKDILKTDEVSLDNKVYRNSFFSQLFTLLHREYLQAKGNMKAYHIQTCTILFVIATMTTFFYDCGNDGSKILGNIFFLVLSILYFAYAAMMPTLTYLPMKMKIVRSEHFNKWYNIGPFFTALTLQILPINFITCGLYVIISYPLTDQPPSSIKMFQFFLILVVIAMVTDALCQIVGFVFDSVNSLFMGIVLLKPVGLFAIQSLGHSKQILPILNQYLIKTSFMRWAIDALICTVYKGRERINCSEDAEICPFTKGDQIITVFGYGGCSFQKSLLILFIFYVCFKLFAFYTLSVFIKPDSQTNSVGRFRSYLNQKLHVES